MLENITYETVAAWVGSFRLLFFFLFFVGLVAWVFWPGRKAEHDKHAQIPLNDDH